VKTDLVKYVKPLIADEVIDKPSNFWELDSDFSTKSILDRRKKLRAMGASEEFIESVDPLPPHYTIDM
jgi:hypothetical protein